MADSVSNLVRRIWLGNWRNPGATKCDACRKTIAVGAFFYANSRFQDQGCCAQCAGIEEVETAEAPNVTTEPKPTTNEVW